MRIGPRLNEKTGDEAHRLIMTMARNAFFLSALSIPTVIVITLPAARAVAADVSHFDDESNLIWSILGRASAP